MANTGRQNWLACGWNHTLVVAEDGKFYGWGVGPDGELGAAQGFVKFDAKILDLPHMAAKTSFKVQPQVAVGAHHTVILSAGGEVLTMGSSKNGRLGHSSQAGVVRFPGDESGIRYIACGTDFTIAVGENGENLYAWGLGIYGNLGDGQKQDRDTPVLFHIEDRRVKIPPGHPVPRKRVVQVACGSRHSLSLCSDGDVFSWGYGMNGRLGLGTQDDHPIPTLIPTFQLSDAQKVVEICAGDAHSMVRTKDGKIYSWGSGSYGRLGLGSESDQYSPKVIEKLKNIDITHISCGAFHSLAVADPKGKASSLYTWGGGKYGKLGLGFEDNEYYPQEVPFFKKRSRKAKWAVCGLQHTVVVATDRVYAFGYAANSRCGVQTQAAIFALPQPIPFFDNLHLAGINMQNEIKTESFVKLPKAKRVAAGLEHSLSLSTDGRVFAFGANDYGQLGTGFHNASFKPIPVSFPVVAVKMAFISCGGFHSIAVDSGGSIYAWGRNDEGQLGLGDIENRAFPVMIEALQGTPIHEARCGYMHTAAIARIHPGQTKSSRVYIWGSNEFGQLGLGKERRGKKQLFPAPLHLPLGDYDQTEISLGRKHTIILATNFVSERVTEAVSQAAKRPDGSAAPADRAASILETHLFTCGWSEYGQLGQGVSSVGTGAPLDQEVEDAPKLVTNWEGFVNYKLPVQITNDVDPTRRELARLPIVKLISAGDNNSLAVVQDRINQVFAWGLTPGLSSAKTNVPTKVREFEHVALQSRLGLVNDIYSLQIEQIRAGGSHYMAVLRYNNNHKAVCTWGETKYGKLGVGNVAAFTDEQKRREQAKRSRATTLFDEDDRSGLVEVEKNTYLPPSFIKSLDDKDITHVSCRGEHCLACSSNSGSVYGWGLGASGRLGLGEDDTSASHQDPEINPFFAHSEFNLNKEDEDEFMDDDDDQQKETAQDEDEDEKTVIESGAGQGGSSIKGVIYGFDTYHFAQTAGYTIGVKKDKRKKLAAVPPFGERNVGLIRPKGTGIADIDQDVNILEKDEAGTDAGKPEAKKDEDDDSKDPVRQALQPKFLPKERFMLIEYSQKLIKKKEEEYKASMEEYFQKLDTVVETQGIVELAIDQRINEVMNRQHDVNTNRDVQYNKVEAQERAVVDEIKVLEALKNEGDESVEGTIEDLKASLKAIRRQKNAKRENQNVLVNRKPPGSLNNLELTTARFYMAPCLFLHLYTNCNQVLRSAELDEAGASNVKRDFCSLLFSVYNIKIEADFKILKTFLLELMQIHIHDTLDRSKVLLPETLEWAVFEYIFKLPQYQKVLREIVHLALLRFSQNAPELLANFTQAGGVSMAMGENERNKAVADLMRVTLQFLSSLISGELMDRTMNLMKWILEIWYDAFKIQKQAENGTLGKRTLQAICLFALTETEKERRSTMGYVLDGETQGYIFHALLGKDVFLNYMQTERRIPKEALKQAMGFFNDLDRFVGAYMTRVEQDKVKDLGDEKKRSPDSALEEALEKEKSLLTDYLNARSTYNRRIVQVDHDCRKLLRVFRFLDGGKAELDEWVDEKHSSKNVGMDIFHTDKELETIKCDRCKLSHPRVEYPVFDDEKKDKDETKNDAADIDEQELKSRVDLTPQNCADLWRTLKEEVFQAIIKKAAGEGAWKEIMRVLKSKRQESFEKKHLDKVEQYEQATKYLRRIREVKPGTMVYLAGQPAIAEQSDPARLFDKLRSIDERSETNEKKAKRNVELYLQLVKNVKSQFRSAQNNIEELKDCVSYICVDREDKRLRAWKSILKDKAEVISRLHSFDKMKVYKEKGSMFKYKYMKLYKQDVLLDDPDKQNFVEPILCFPVDSCQCCREGGRAQAQAEFYAGLEFHFISTDSDDVFEIKVVFDGQLLRFHKVALCFLKKDEDADPRLRALARARGVKDECDRIEYDPQGDRVPVTKVQTFIFNKTRLLEELSTLPRPPPGRAGTGVSDLRASDLTNVLSVIDY